jgi:hypothetical protein
MPRHKTRQLRAAVARRGRTREVILEETLDRLYKDSAFASRCQAKAAAIFVALGQGSYHPSLFPRSLTETLAIGACLNALHEQSAEEHLLEMSEAELALVERVCIERGIEYEDFMAAAISDVYSKGGLQESDEEDGDSADWWKRNR